MFLTVKEEFFSEDYIFQIFNLNLFFLYNSLCLILSDLDVIILNIVVAVKQ